MTEPSKKLSRRDAIKLIGAAAGASVLATLPTKWTKPEITTGVLPAHALTSAPSAPSAPWPYSFISCNQNTSISVNGIVAGPLSAYITPATAGVSLKLAIAINNNVTVNSDPSGTYLTDNAGYAQSNTISVTSGIAGANITLEWTFVGNPLATPCRTTYSWV